MKQRLIIILYIIAVALPLLLGLGYSLLYSFGLIGALGKGFTWAHWERLLVDQEALLSIAYTCYLAIASVIGSVSIALLMTYWLSIYKHRATDLYKVLFLPLTLPPLIASFAFFHMLSPSGVLSRIAYALGLIEGMEAFSHLINDQWGIGILLTHLFIVAPFFSLMFANIAEKERLLALKAMSATLGSSSIGFIRRIFIPMILYKARPLIVLYGIFFFGTYEVPLLLGRQSPQALTLFITDKMDKFDLMNIPVGHAMAVVYTLIIGLIATVFLWRQKEVSL